MSRNLILKLTMLTSLAFGALTISACGFLSMPDKMDQTNGAMASMQQKMDTTNTTTAAMGSKMDQTNESIRKQTLEVALDHLLAKENTTYLSPAPTGMMPWAQAFADNMHEDEFVQLVYLYMQEINEVKPPDSMKYTCTLADLADPNPNPTDLTDACLKASQQAKKIDPTTKTIKIFTPDFIASVDHDKTVKYYAVMAISGFASIASRCFNGRENFKEYSIVRLGICQVEGGIAVGQVSGNPL